MTVYSTFEGNEFVFDTLEAGTVINYRAFFLKDVMYVNMRAKTEVKLLFYTSKKLNEHLQKYNEVQEFATRVLIA